MLRQGNGDKEEKIEGEVDKGDKGEGEDQDKVVHVRGVVMREEDSGSSGELDDFSD